MEKLKVRGDVSALGGMSESPVGVWVSNYISRSVTVTEADVQGMRVGVFEPVLLSSERRGRPGRVARCREQLLPKSHRRERGNRVHLQQRDLAQDGRRAELPV